MSVKRVKTPAKIFSSDVGELENIILRTVNKIEQIVGSSLGPGGKPCLIESELPGIPNTSTKDGVTIFRALGSEDAYEHLIIEQTRDAAIRTVNEAGDGTTTATVIASALIKKLFAFCKNNPKYSPQKIAREVSDTVNKKLIPQIRAASIKINTKNQGLLEQVATISANGDTEMAASVMKAFEEVGFGANSHVTIQQLSGPSGYNVELIEGFPVSMGYEESIGKFHTAFINDQAHQRCVLEKPLFVLFDGKVMDMVQLMPILSNIGEEYVNGNSDFANVVIVAHAFSDKVLTNLSFNFNNPNTINVVPLATPKHQMVNYQLHFLQDLAAFTGASIFDMTHPVDEATPDDLGSNMHKIEIYRFRSTIIGDPDELNIESRANDIETLKDQSESKIEKVILEERLGKLTNGIARLQIFGSSNGELKEKADRAEDAVCAVRAAINHGCLPGGCRVLINLALGLLQDESSEKSVREVLVPALWMPFYRLLSNQGYNEQEIEEITERMIDPKNINKVFDVDSGKMGDAKKLGLYDATLAVEQALKNATSIASVLGTMGGIIAFPRDGHLERQEHAEQMNFQRNVDNAGSIVNEANERP